MTYAFSQIMLLLTAQPTPEAIPVPEPTALSRSVLVDQRKRVHTSCQPNAPEAEIVVEIVAGLIAKKSDRLDYRGIQVIDVERVNVPDDLGRMVQTLRFRGLLSAATQGQRLQQEAEMELESRKEEIGWPLVHPVRVDVSQMYVEAGRPFSDMAKVLVIERFMDDVLTEQMDRPPKPGDVVQEPRVIGRMRVLLYDPHLRQVCLCGAAPNHHDLARIACAVQRLPGVDRVCAAHVLLIDARKEETTDRDIHYQTATIFGEAIGAARHCEGPKLIALADMMIRQGRISPSVWYLRAAGHLLCGDDIHARGDVRLAGVDIRRHRLLEGFQGPLRDRLEFLVEASPFVSVGPHPPTGTPAACR